VDLPQSTFSHRQARLTLTLRAAIIAPTPSRPCLASVRRAQATPSQFTYSNLFISQSHIASVRKHLPLCRVSRRCSPFQERPRPIHPPTHTPQKLPLYSIKVPLKYCHPESSLRKRRTEDKHQSTHPEMFGLYPRPAHAVSCREGASASASAGRRLPPARRVVAWKSVRGDLVVADVVEVDMRPECVSQPLDQPRDN
jgi:hypothetical protein